jgi:hypothetical protein
VELFNLLRLHFPSLLLVDDVEHFYSTHIHTIECSWRLANVLACSQKVSHPGMRLVSAAIGASFYFPFWNACKVITSCSMFPSWWNIKKKWLVFFHLACLVGGFFFCYFFICIFFYILIASVYIIPFFSYFFFKWLSSGARVLSWSRLWSVFAVVVCGPRLFLHSVWMQGQN